MFLSSYLLDAAALPRSDAVYCVYQHCRCVLKYSPVPLCHTHLIGYPAPGHSASERLCVCVVERQAGTRRTDLVHLTVGSIADHLHQLEDPCRVLSGEKVTGVRVRPGSGKVMLKEESTTLRVL